MRFVRVAAAATALLFIGATTSLGPAAAAATGVGTSTASTSILHVSLGTDGSLLDVRLLGDDAQSTIDSKTAPAPTAFSKLTALRATSTVLEVPTAADPTVSAPLDLTVSAIESRQPGGQAEVNQSSIDLANPGVSPVVPGLGDIIQGTLTPVKLTSLAETATAKSTLSATLANAKVAGAVLEAQSLASTLQSTTTATESTSTRAVDVDAITVLNLGALLDGLDIAITNLTPAQVSALLDKLGVAIPGIDPGTTLLEVFDAIQAEITTLLTTPITLGGAGDVIDGLGLGGVIDTSVIDDIDTGIDAAAQTAALIQALEDALADVLSSAVSALDATPLLKLNGVDVSVVTKAADTLANSAATVTGKIGSVTVGNLEVVPEIDLLATAATINSTVASINNTLSDTLAGVTGAAIDLSDLVTVEVLKKTSSVATVNGYNTATAGLTGLTAKITPPAELAALVTAIKGQAATTAIGAEITAAGGSLPALGDSMSSLETTLGTGIQALQGGATINVVEVMGVSEFRAVATTTAAPTTPTLPATGNHSWQLTAAGLLLVAFGLGLGRWFNMPTPAWVRRRMF